MKLLKKIFEAPFNLVGWLFRDIYGRVVGIFLLALIALMVNYPVRDTVVGTWEVRDTLAEQFSRESGQSDVDAAGRVDRSAIQERKIIARRELNHRLAYFTLPFHSVAEREVQVLDFGWDETGKLRVKHRLVEWVSRGLTLGLDLQGGTELRYRILTEDDGQIADANEIAEIIRRRVDAYGLKEPRIQPIGQNRILVQIPGFDASDVSRVKAIISRIGRLEFRLVAHPEQDAAALQEAERTGQAPEGWHWYTLERTEEERQGETERLLISDEIQLTGENIDRVSVGPGGATGSELAVQLRFKDREAFWNVTLRNTGRRLAIMLDDVRNSQGNLMRQGRLHSAPQIREAILGAAEITGGFTQKSAEDLKYVLQSGSLDAPLESESEQFVGPYQGKRSIEQGSNAVVIGFISVMAFIAIYYLKAGLVANFALLLNLILLVAALGLRGATLTLPGIAGIILTVGMAVDANVLIFERIREELRKTGDKPLLKCMRDGHSKALVTIIDANLTTLITSIILYEFGTGPVRGFAVTLAYGLAISMFSAIVVTRIVFEAMHKAGWLKSLPMLKIIPTNPNIPFIPWRKFFMVISAAVVVASLAYFFVAPGNRLGIEFSSGTLVQVNLSEKVNAEVVRSRLAQAGYENAEVQELAGTAGEKVERISSSFAIRLRYVPQVKITQSRRMTDTEAGGAEVIVRTDRQANPQQMAQRLEAEGSLGATMQAAGEQDSMYEYIIRTPDNSADAVSALESNVRIVFESELVTGDIRAAFDNEQGSLLVPEGVKLISDEGGTMTARIALSEPTTADQVRRTLEDRVTGVNVSPVDEAADGRAGVFNITAPSGALAEIKDTLRLAGFSTLEPFGSVTRIFPSVARELTTKASIAVGLALIAIVAYVWFRFEFRFGMAAVIALVHDVSITLGALALTGRQISLTVIAAILTIIGYSLNDTIVVFDRIRENRKTIRKVPFPDLINMSLNQTLSRTMLTSLTTVFAVLALYIFGGPAIDDFAFALLVGIVVGTYSSIFIASPILLMTGEQGTLRGPLATPTPVTAKKKEILDAEDDAGS